MASTLKRRKLNPATPEIVFDDSARADFLTGFHKRKQARIKQAQELAAKIERRDKLQDRATVRFRQPTLPC
jgi:ribosomal RNA-processing protein 17